MVRKQRIKDFSAFQELNYLSISNLFEPYRIPSEKDFERRRSHFSMVTP